MIGEGHCAKAASPRVARRDVVAGIAVLSGTKITLGPKKECKEMAGMLRHFVTRVI